MKKLLGSLIISSGLLIGYLALGNIIYPTPSSFAVAGTIKPECNMKNYFEQDIHKAIQDTYFNHIPDSHKVYDKYTMIVYYLNKLE